MKHEIEAASEFLTRAIFHAYDAREQTTTFYNVLCCSLANKFANHWYEETPIKGQAFRSIIVDCENGFIDNLILQCAKISKTHNIAKRLEVAFPAGFRMWIDPGEVEVEYLCDNGNDVIYSTERPVTQPKRIQRPPSPQNFKSASYEYYERPPSPSAYLSSSPPSTPMYLSSPVSPKANLVYKPTPVSSPSPVYVNNDSSPILNSVSARKPITISQNCASEAIEIQGIPVNNSSRYQQRVM